MQVRMRVRESFGLLSCLMISVTSRSSLIQTSHTAFRNIQTSSNATTAATTTTTVTTSVSGTKNGKLVDAYIALGSNMGDKVTVFHEALKRLSLIGTLHDTSYLYETPPMYYEDQPSFLNAACHITTTLSPLDLLVELKKIEEDVGRKESFRNGPRLIDLDIILYDKDYIMNTTQLTIPHPRVHERGFVLKPLDDIASTVVHPIYNTTIASLLHQLPSDGLKNMKQVFPIQSKRLVDMNERVLVCGIVNVTPDSFSDGGNYHNNVNAAVDHCLQLLADGADILDIGGESTRPGANNISADEEIERVIPVIKGIRSTVQGSNCIISIDTRKSVVAAAAIDAGADIINDVSGGVYDTNILNVAAMKNKPIILMHMRGNPSNMIDKCNYNNVIHDVANELSIQTKAAMNACIPRWMQIVDPGIGFAKDIESNVALLKPNNLLEVKKLLGNRPMMIGVSRKRFLRSILKDVVDDIDERSLDDATLGLSCLSVVGGASILRVHSVKQVKTLTNTILSVLSK